MQDGVWRTINGHKVFIKNKQVNDYMNNKIRNNKTYTKADITKSKSEYGDYIYSCNGVNLMKQYDMFSEKSNWWIITKNNTDYQTGIFYSKASDKGEAMTVDNYKEGLEKIVEIANNKKLQGTNKVK